jgi:hypothetical protein
MSEAIEIGFDFNQAAMTVEPATLRRIADALEADGKASATMWDYDSDPFEITIQRAEP